MDRLPPHPSSSCATSDIDPRLGFAYDLRDDGRTALKVSASRYGQRDATDWAEELNPALSNRTQTRSWNDLNHDGYPQGDPFNPAPNGERGWQARPQYFRQRAMVPIPQCGA